MVYENFSAELLDALVVATWGDWDEVRYGTSFDLPDLGTVKVVKTLGGDSDGAAVCVIVECQGRFFQKTGRYSSWSGCEFVGPIVEVEPYEETVINYRPIS